MFTNADGVTFGSFQQLLRDADSGLLRATYNSDDIFELRSNATNHNSYESQLNCAMSQQGLLPQDFVDDGYSAGTESEADTPIHVQHSRVLVDSDDITCLENEGYVSFTDPIGKDEFMAGRDLDYGVCALGIDDTDANNVGLEAEGTTAIDYTDMSTVQHEDNIVSYGHINDGINGKGPGQHSGNIVDIPDDTNKHYQGRHISYCSRNLFNLHRWC